MHLAHGTSTNPAPYAVWPECGAGMLMQTITAAGTAMRPTWGIKVCKRLLLGSARIMDGTHV